MESSRVVAATPDFFGEWVGGPLTLKYLHYKNSTTHKNIKNKLLKNFRL